MKAQNGVISASILIIMCIVFNFRKKNKILSSIFMPISFCILFVVTQLIAYESLFTIVLIIGDIFLTIAMWDTKEVRIKLFVLLCAICFLTYNISILTIIGIVTQSISILTNAYYLIKHRKDFKLKEENI